MLLITGEQKTSCTLSFAPLFYFSYRINDNVLKSHYKSLYNFLGKMFIKILVFSPVPE